jgi:hypothetical protein
MSFGADLTRFAEKTARREQAVFTTVAVELRESVKFGSPLTGAPSMPVAPSNFPRAGSLRDSVTLVFPDPNTALLYTASPYARDVEDNPKGHEFHEGGPHGWKMTVAAFERVVDTTAKRIVGYSGG